MTGSRWLGAAVAAVAALWFGSLPRALAETYHVRDDGTATQSQAAASSGGGCTEATAAMSVAAHNVGTFQPGDTIYICGAISNPSRFVPPSSGTAGSPITYRGDHPGHPGSFEQVLWGTDVWRMFHIRNRQHLRLLNLAFKSNAGIGSDSERTAVWVEEYYEPTGHIEIDGCEFFQTVNGVFLQGDVRQVGIFRSTFRNLVNNGVGIYNYYGRNDTVPPSFVTVGGSREGANTFANIGREDNPSPGSVPGQVFGTQGNDLVFSYNHVYADAPGWGTGVYLNGVHRVLIEYNYIHDIDSVHRRPAITIKSDYDWSNKDIVIRFNKIGPTHAGGNYVRPDIAIIVNRCVYGAVIYGNYMYNVTDVGIMVDWGWEPVGADDGCIVEDVFVYANVVDRSFYNSGISFTGTWEGNDPVRNSYIVNNTLYRTVSDISDAGMRYAINTIADTHKYDGLTIKNNIIDRTRDQATPRVGIRAWVQANLAVDYNHHHHPDGVPQVHYDGSSCAPCDWDGSARPAGYGANDSGGDPRFVAPENLDFSLRADSPCRDSGESLPVEIPSFTIQGVRYDFSLAEGLDPERTDWNSLIPVVATLDQNRHGSGWEKGAYVYAEVPACAEGEIAGQCVCGGSRHDSGYCCGDSWQSTPCSGEEPDAGPADDGSPADPGPADDGSLADAGTGGNVLVGGGCGCVNSATGSQTDGFSILIALVLGRLAGRRRAISRP